MSRWIQYSLIVALLVSGCGFHLRGTTPSMTAGFAYCRVRVSGNALAMVVENKLRHFEGVTVNAPSGGEQIHLSIEHEKIDSQALGLNEAGKINEARLTYHVVFSVSKAGLPWLAPTSLALYRDYPYHNDPVRDQAQEALLLKDMQDDVALQIIYRINGRAGSIPCKEKSGKRTSSTPSTLKTVGSP